MTKIKTTLFDVADYLHSPEDMAEFLNACMEEGSVDLLLRGLKEVARAYGMMKLAEAGSPRSTTWRYTEEPVTCHACR